MKALPLLATAFALFLYLGVAAPLDPPGPPAPTMKSLEEVEPRTHLSQETTPGDATSVFLISEPGSYYLAGNLTGQEGRHGITITASDVTLDLNGFTLLGTPGSLDGIHQEGSMAESVRVSNGTIKGWGDAGLRLPGNFMRVTDVQVLRCGGIGIQVGTASRCIDCVVHLNGATGLLAAGNVTVEGCTATENSGPGISVGNSSIVTRSIAARNTADGIRAGLNSSIATSTTEANSQDGFDLGINFSISGSSAYDNEINGFRSDGNTTVLNCTARSNSQDGFSIGNGSTILNSSARINTAAGFDLGTSGNVVGCNAYDNDGTGFELATGSLLKDSVAGNNEVDGLMVEAGSAVRDCTIRANGGDGAVLGEGSFIGGSVVTNNSPDGNILFAGIDAERLCRIEGNFLVRNGGFEFSAREQSLVIGNYISGSTYNVASNIKGEFLNGPAESTTNSISNFFFPDP